MPWSESRGGTALHRALGTHPGMARRALPARPADGNHPRPTLGLRLSRSGRVSHQDAKSAVELSPYQDALPQDCANALLLGQVVRRLYPDSAFARGVWNCRHSTGIRWRRALDSFRIASDTP